MLFRLLPVVLIISIILGVSIYFIFKPTFLSSESKKPISDNIQDIVSRVQGGTDTDSTTADQDSRIDKLTTDVEKLKKDFASMPSSSTLSGEFVSQSKFGFLETAFNQLKSRVDSLENKVNSNSSTAQSTTAAATPYPRSPIYVTIGAESTVGDRNYLSVPGFTVQLNSADYPGYSSVQLEVNFRLQQSVGTANAALYNSTTSQLISSSNVSTTSTSFTFQQSGGFQLTSGVNQYQLQVQSTEGYPVEVQNARVRINF